MKLQNIRCSFPNFIQLPILTCQTHMSFHPYSPAAFFWYSSCKSLPSLGVTRVTVMVVWDSHAPPSRPVASAHPSHLLYMLFYQTYPPTAFIHWLFANSTISFIWPIHLSTHKLHSSFDLPSVRSPITFIHHAHLTHPLHYPSVLTH